MSSEVDWVLTQLGSVVDSVATDYTQADGSSVVVKRVDRDNAEIYDGSGSLSMASSIRSRSGELEKGVFIGATLADSAPTPRGFDYNTTIERTVGVRIEGLHETEWGHVDPDGADGVPFDELVERVRQALYAAREFPAAGDDGVEYGTLFIENEAPNSSAYADFFQHSLDVRFRGRQSLP